MTTTATAIRVLPPIHRDRNSAWCIPDYPYGRQLRCTRYVWIEVDKKKGHRFVSVTTDPKHGHRENKPHKSTFHPALVLYINDETGHLESSSFCTWGSSKEMQAWLDRFRFGLTPLDATFIEGCIKMKIDQEEAKAIWQAKTGKVYAALVRFVTQPDTFMPEHLLDLEPARELGYMRFKYRGQHAPNAPHTIDLVKDSGATCSLLGMDSHDDLRVAFTTRRMVLDAGGVTAISEGPREDGYVDLPWVGFAQ